MVWVRTTSELGKSLNIHPMTCLHAGEQKNTIAEMHTIKEVGNGEEPTEY